MTLPNFPTLTDAVTGRVYKPSVKNFSQKMALDPTIRTKLEDGRKSTSNPTPNLPTVFSVMYESIPLLSRNEILDFESGTVFWNTLPFAWTDEPSSDIVTVMFVAPIRWQHTAENAQRFDVYLIMEETQDNFS